MLLALATGEPSGLLAAAITGIPPTMFGNATQPLTLNVQGSCAAPMPNPATWGLPVPPGSSINNSDSDKLYAGAVVVARILLVTCVLNVTVILTFGACVVVVMTP